MARARKPGTGAAGPIKARGPATRITDTAKPRAGAGTGSGARPGPAIRPIDVKALQSGIEQTVTQQVAARLSTNGAGLPANLKTAISKASGEAAARAIDLAVTKEINDAVTDVTRGPLLGKFDARVDLARKGLDHIVANDDVKRIMTQRAQMLAEKKRALETAGFSSEEAMQILLADIAARGH